MANTKSALTEQQKYIVQELVEKYGWELSPSQVAESSKNTLTELYWHRKNNTGPKFKKRIGKGKNTKVVYPVMDFVAFLTADKTVGEINVESLVEGGNDEL